jgi:type IV pilus assembly protein PilM
MANKVISIEIGLQTTKMCEVSLKKNNPQVYNCISFPTPEDTFEDGYIRDKYKFVAVVKDKIKEANFKSNKVIFTVASNKIANREVILPIIKENRIQDVVNANASEYFPVDVSDYILSYSIIEKVVTKDEKKMRLLVLAAPSNLIKNYYNVAELLGLEVEAIDYIGNSIFHVIKKQVTTGSNLVIQMNDQTTLINIFEDNVLQLQRTISYGTSTLVNELTSNKELNIQNDYEALQVLFKNELIHLKFDDINNSSVSRLDYISNEVLEEVAATISFIGSADKDKVKVNYTQVKDDVTDSLRYLVNNIARVIDYYSSKSKKSVDTIYLTGQGTKLNGFEDLLRNETGIDTKKFEYSNMVNLHKKMNTENLELNEFIACIGATMKPIQFVPKDMIQNAKQNTHTLKFVLGLTCVVCIAFVANSFLTYQIAKQENARLNSEIASLAELDTLYSVYTSTTNTYNNIKSMYSMTLNPNQKLNNLITELEQLLPKEAIIETLNVTSADLTLSIKGDSKVTAAKVLQQLKGCTFLTGIRTSGITETKDEMGIVTVNFVVSANYNIMALQEETNADTK